MKKLLILLAMILLPLMAIADDSGKCGENVTYTFNETTKTLTISGNGEMDWFRGHGWSIKDKETPWKSYQDEILHVVIESNVTSIGDGSFWGCSNLKTVSIPSTITKIKSAAFAECSKLEGVYLSDLEAWCNINFGPDPTTMDVSSNPLYYAHNLYLNGEKIKELVIPEGISEIKICSFCGFSEMTSLHIPNSVISINAAAFQECKGLINLDIPNSVTLISSYAFSDCEALTTVKLSENLKEIDSYAFQNCTSLFSVIIPNSVTTLHSAFDGCTGLTYVTLSNNLKKVSGFYGCSSLTTMILPEGVESIEPLAFYGCSNLSSITIPSSLTTIKDNAFRQCSKLKIIKLTDIAKWCGIEFNGDYCHPFQYSYGGKIYKNDEEIIDLEIPDGVTYISAKAFISCIGIKSVKMPQTVNKIGEQAFSGCYNLEKVDMSENIQKLENKTFYGCKLNSVTIPSSVQYIYSQVFDGCNNLESVRVKAEAPPFLNSTAFSNYSIPLYVPDNSLESYQKANTWSQFSSILPLSSADKYKLIYMVDGVEYKSYDIEFGATITPEPAPTKEGYIFSGWSELPATMPAHDVTVIGTFTIVDPVTITAKSYSRKYGEANPNFEYTSEGTTLTGVPEITCEATPASPVGEYPIIISKGTVTNYNDHYVNGKLTITKAPLTITAKSYTIKQGDALPTFEAEYSGFKNNETKAVLTTQPTITTTATSASAPGTYEIVVSGASATNYDISYVKGTLTITKADEVVVTAKSYSRKYGEANPAFEYTTSGATLSGIPSITCEATATSPVGEYDIVASKGTVTNYNVTYVNGKLTITKAPLTITAKSYTIKQGDALPTFEAEYSGFKNNETKAVLSAQPTITTSATSASAPGTYEIIVSGASATNYDISYVKGTLTISPVDVEPVKETETTTFSETVNENTNLSNTVIDNTYFNMNAANGDGYDATEQAIVLNSTTTESQMNTVENAELGDAAIRQNFNGIIFEVAAGSGTITIDVRTKGTHVLNVQIGKGEPTKINRSTRGTADVAYNVTAPTYIYLYASTASGNAAPRRVASANSVLLYGYKVTPGGTGIREISADSPVDVYNMQGNKVRSKATTLSGLPKGIYIVNGRKVIVK